MTKEFTLEDYGINQASNLEIQDALADKVRKSFDKAVEHRRRIGIDTILMRNLRANKCQYQPDEAALIGPYNDVYMGVAALKARGAESWITDIILSNIEKPWTIDPTPTPDLSSDQTERVVDDLLKDLDLMNSVEALKDRARELKSAHASIAYKNAEDATARMETKIEDQMAEGEWVSTFTDFIAELVAYPAAFIRGPIVVGRTVGAWDGNNYIAKNAEMPITRCVSAFDAYPSPDAKDIQNGLYFCERARLSASELYSLIGVEGFNGGNIRQVLDEHEDGFSFNNISDSERDTLEGIQTDGTYIEFDSTGLYETVIYNGKIRGDLLVEHGVIVEDKQKSYEVEVYLVGKYVIRAILNPNPSGTRPIYKTSYRKIVGNFWGQSVIDLVYDIGRVCNAAARNLVKNMGYSSGPIGEVASDRVEDTQDPTEISPYIVKLVGPDLSGTGAAAYRFTKIASVAAELTAVYDHYMKYADDMSGVPSYVLGNPQVAGAGRTLGGLSMLMGNAAKGIKNVQLNVDNDVISGLITGFYVYNMSTSKDDSIKADAKVRARGATGLLQRELAQTRTVELLQLLAPYISEWDNLPDGIKIMLREILKTTGLPIDDIIPDPQKGDDAVELMSLLGNPAGGGVGRPGAESGNMAVALNRGTSTPVPLPPQSLPPPGPMQTGPVPVNMPQGA